VAADEAGKNGAAEIVDAIRELTKAVNRVADLVELHLPEAKRPKRPAPPKPSDEGLITKAIAASIRPTPRDERRVKVDPRFAEIYRQIQENGGEPTARHIELLREIGIISARPKRPDDHG
jgi:hypothetical protein